MTHTKDFNEPPPSSDPNRTKIDSPSSNPPPSPPPSAPHLTERAAFQTQYAIRDIQA